MQKWTVFVCFGLLAVTLSACGGPKPQAQSTPAPVPTPTPSPVVTASAAPTPLPTPLPTATAAPTPETAPTTEPLDLQATPALDVTVEVGVNKPAAMALAFAGADDVTLLFVPRANEADITAFSEAPEDVPHITSTFDPEKRAFLLTVHDTTLQSGTLEPGHEDWVYDYVEERGLTFPYQVSMGSIGADGDYFTNAAISSNGTDTYVSLMLTERTEGYLIDTYTEGDGSLPVFHIQFVDAE